MVHMDIVGPLPPATPRNETYPSKFRYILTCIDRTTRWIEATPLTDITASTIAITFLNSWITRFGAPLYVVTDRGSQFENELFLELSKLIGFYRLRTTSYHPQANGIIERQHRTLKTSIMSRKQNWLGALPIVLLGMRNIPKEDDVSPTIAMTDTHFFLPQPIISSISEQSFSSSDIQKLAKEMNLLSSTLPPEGRLHTTTKPFIPNDLKNCTHVWIRVDRVRRPLEAPYNGPFKVIYRTEKYFRIQLPSGHSENISIDRLKPVYIKDLSTSTSEKPQSQNKINEPLNSSLGTTETLIKESSAVQTPKEIPCKLTRSGRKVTFHKKKMNITIFETAPLFAGESYGTPNSKPF